METHETKKNGRVKCRIESNNVATVLNLVRPPHSPPPPSSSLPGYTNMDRTLRNLWTTQREYGVRMLEALYLYAETSAFTNRDNTNSTCRHSVHQPIFVSWILFVSPYSFTANVLKSNFNL